MSLCNQSWFQGYATWSVLDQRAEDNLSILKTILEEQESIPPSNDIENKAKLFYHTCMKWSETSKTTLHNCLIDLVCPEAITKSSALLCLRIKYMAFT